ncbi:hypothetical protein AAF712_003048 [Marasmius tenuissimus]|uniref:CT20-domain-containing protein n=1 Tax=Marasmius tenuissimus TaxID=585030 RepID=A0ABR3A8V5_9AGAR
MSEPFLDSVQGEIAFFRAVMHSRPIGIHRNFHLISMRSAIHKDTGEWVDIPDIVKKLRNLYDVDALNAIDIEIEGYEMSRSHKSTPISIPSPTPSENLNAHPFFRDEYALPFDPSIRSTPSPPSSPTPSEPPRSAKQPPRSKKKRGKSKANLAGLVGGDSDSSALTQESGDEAVAESVATGTDGETVDGDAEDEDIEMNEPSPSPGAVASTSKPSRRRTSTASGKKKLRGAALANAARSAAKKKAAAAKK